MQSLQLPKKTEHAVRWLTATLKGETGPGTDYPVPLRHLLLKGGRGSGKSHTAARIVVNVVKALGVRALCTRETQKSIEESVYQLLSDVITDVGYDDDFQKKKTTIDCKNGGAFLFAGLRQQDVAKIKSTEKIMICWCEEAHVLSEHSLEVLTPTVREDNSVIIYTYNPELDDDPVHARFALDPQPDVCVVTLNWRDNPWFPKVLERERIRTYERDKTNGKFKYNWIWEGHCLPAVEGAIYADEVASFQTDGRFMRIDHDTRGKVYIVMDLGYGVTTMALWQRFASTMQCIDYYEFYRTKYSIMASIVKKDHPHVRWGKVAMPHDAAHHDPKTAESHKDTMRALGWEVMDVHQIGVENYIEKGRELFDTAYLDNREHEPDTPGISYVRSGKRLLQCLKRYRRQIPQTTGHPGAPLKDEWAHGGETWCYTAVIADEMTNDDMAIPKNPYKGYSG
jgi:phage terminase large subunit